MTARKPQQPVFRADGFCNEAGAAQFLGRSAACLRAWRAAERGPPYIQVDGRGPVLYECTELERWLLLHKHVPGVDPPREERRDANAREKALADPARAAVEAPNSDSSHADAPDRASTRVAQPLAARAVSTP